MEKTTHIAIVSSPGYSHLIPIVEFSKRLVHLQPDFHVTCIIPSFESPPSASKAILGTLPPNIDSIFLPPVSKEVLPEGISPGVKIQLTVTHSLPYLHEALKSLSSEKPLAAVVADSFAFEALDFAKEFNAFSFIYFPSGSTFLSLFFYLEKLDQTISGEFRDLTEPVEIPGCVPFRGTDLPDPLQDRSGQSYKIFLERARSYYSFDGVLVNSFLEMETGSIRDLTEGKLGSPPIYPVGPITPSGSGSEGNGSECLKWLDKQPPNSVVYVSFGSGGTLSQDQITALALGLELSGHKFLWAIRAPSTSSSGAYLGGANEGDPLQFLPNGFLERTKEEGLVVPSWAPQILVLSHSAVGGFLTHCGWNSILESVLQGVPLLAWPLFAEQRMNAVVVTDELKVALRPKVNERGIREKDEIGKVIKSVMEGEDGKKIRKRIRELKEAAHNAIKKDGPSTKTLIEVTLKLKDKFR